MPRPLKGVEILSTDAMYTLGPLMLAFNILPFEGKWAYIASGRYVAYRTTTLGCFESIPVQHQRAWTQNTSRIRKGSVHVSRTRGVSYPDLFSSMVTQNCS